MRIIAATKNSGKVCELKEILGDLGFEIVSQSEVGIEADVCETGQTFSENASIKARAIAMLCDDAVIADDSGLCVNALGGEPGIYSARYAGEHGNDKLNNAKLIRELGDAEDRSAYFECAVSLIMPNGDEISASGKTFGTILTAPEGSDGFGYDPLFYSDDLGKSFGVAASEEKNSVSHRGRALSELYTKLKLYLENR